MNLFYLTGPAMIIATLIKDPGPAAKFLKAGAISPETARNPVSVKVTRRSHLEGLIRRGVLVDAGEGRLYVNVDAYRRQRRRIIMFVVIAAIIATGVVWVVLST